MRIKGIGLCEEPMWSVGSCISHGANLPSVLPDFCTQQSRLPCTLKCDRGTVFFPKCSKRQPLNHTVLLTNPLSSASPWKLHSAHPPPPPHAGPLGSRWMLFQWLVDCGLCNLSLEGAQRRTSEKQQSPLGTCGFLAWTIYKLRSKAYCNFSLTKAHFPLLLLLHVLFIYFGERRAGNTSTHFQTHQGGLLQFISIGTDLSSGQVFLLRFIYLLIYFWMLWVFVGSLRLSLVVTNKDCSLVLGHRLVTVAPSLVAEHGLSSGGARA